MTPTPHPLPAPPAPARWWAWLVCGTVLLPWINPLSSGPSPNTLPLLLSALCMLALASAYGLWGRHMDMQHTQRTLCRAWLLAALLACAMGLLQYLGLADPLSPWVSHAPVGEAYANLRQRNQFASLSSIGLVSLLYLAASGTHHPHTGWRAGLRPLRVWLALAVLAMGNAASASRTGVLQWLMVAVLAGIWSRPGQRQGLYRALGAVLLYGAAAALLPVLLQHITGQEHTGLMGRLAEPAGCESRRLLWANVWELIAQKPGWGWGWGELKWAHFSHAYTGPRFCAILDNAHNLPLHLALSWGVPVASLLCGALGVGLVLRQPWREPDAARQVAWAVLALIGLHSLVEYPLWYGPFQMALALCLWLLWPRSAALTANSTPHRHPRGWGASAAWAIGTLGALVFLLYAAWDYSRVSQLYLPPSQRWALFQPDTLEQARATWLFAPEVAFAELTTTALTEDTAARQYALAGQLLHFSPEPRVVQVLLESAAQLGRDDDTTRAIRQQFQAAYPDAYAQWMQAPVLEP